MALLSHEARLSLPSEAMEAGARPASTDSRWFRGFYDQHADFVRHAVTRLGGPRTDPDDLLQQVFLIAHRRWRSVARPGQLDAEARAWLWAVALRVASESRRRHRVRRFFGFEQASPQTDETPATAFERREAAERVERLLEKLSEKKRAVLVLFEIEGLSGEEIAAVLGCPLKTVWTRLFHARKAFELALARDEARLQRESAGGAR